MLEHAHRTLAAAEHLADLARGKAVDEAQHNDLPPIVRQAGHRGAQTPRVIGLASQASGVGRGRGPLGQRIERRRPVPAAGAQGVGKLVVRDPEQP